MINYILQIILFQVLFLAIYDFFLSKETFFTKNRWYLISTPILSFLLPLIKIPTFQKVVPQEYIVQLPEIFLSPEKVIQRTVMYQSVNEVNYLNVLFYVGVVLFSILFLVKFFKIITLIRKNEIIKKTTYKLVLLPKQTKAFSFFNFIFLGKEIPISQQEQIIAHEFVHSKQKHSFDLLFFEFLKIAMWFNPMIYFYQKRITLLHEYISDEVAAKSATKEMYINNLLSNFFQVENIAFVNQFYKKTLIKKRIIMMKKTQSKKMNQLKYLVLIPVLASMLFYTSCANNAGEEVVSKKELRTTYHQLGQNEIQESKGKNETYLDSYMGTEIPNWEEITYNDLGEEEKYEYDELIEKHDKSDNLLIKSTTVKLYKGDNGRNIIANIIDISKYKEKSKNRKSSSKETIETEDVSFMIIDKAPTFPGCEAGDKDCFSKKIQKHFLNNFDSKLPKTLGLKSGRKRVFIGFKIDKEGNIVDVKARAPHDKIEEEVIKVMNLLPKVTPGEQDGKAVAVTYSIPFVILVE
jgi:hypothetical protein